jgi:hypothetical protein
MTATVEGTPAVDPMIPPQDLPAEHAVLGGALNDAGLAALIAQQLRPEHFYTEAHRSIFRQIQQLVAVGAGVDHVSLEGALRQSGEWEAVGGSPKVMGLIEDGLLVIPANAPRHVAQVLEAWEKRELRRLGLRIVGNGAGPAAIKAEIAVKLEELNVRDIRTTSPPVIREGLDLSMTWPSGAIQMALTAVRVGKRGVEGEITIRQAARTLHWGALSLGSGPARESLVRKLRDRAPWLPWGELLEEACARFTAAARAGEPIVGLTGDAPLATPDLVAPIVIEGQTTTVFSDGDSGKSLLGAAISVAAASGIALPGGLRPRRQVPTMVLDWETDRGAWDGRVAGLCAGLGLDVPEGMIYYRQMAGALADEATMLAAEAVRRRVGLVIVDSLAPACGPEPDGADAVTRTFNALRLFAPAARLVIAHVSKADADRREGARPFGSVFVWNLSRSVWEIKRDPEPAEPGLTMALQHRKCNVGPRHAPLGLRFVFGPGTITPYPINLADTPQLTRGVSLAWRIRTTLAGGRLTVAALADMLEAEPETVARTLRRLRKDGKAADLGEGYWGLKA